MGTFDKVVFGSILFAYAVVAAYVMGMNNPSVYGKFEVICEFSGGVVKDDVCVKGGVVLNIPKQ